MRAGAAGSPHSTACPPGPGKPRSPPACPPPTWAPAGAFPWGPQCALLRRSPHSISGEESEIIAQVSTRLQLQLQRDGCGQGCGGSRAAASRQTSLPAQPRLQRCRCGETGAAGEP